MLAHQTGVHHCNCNSALLRGAERGCRKLNIEAIQNKSGG
jgi:hypothetical protein